MRNIRQYPVEILEEVFYEHKINADGFNLELVSNEIESIIGFTIWRKVVFKDLNDSKYFMAFYEEDTSWEQDDPGFRTNEANMVECTEVKPVIQTIYEEVV